MTTVFPGLNPKYGLLTTARRGSGGAVQILYDSFTATAWSATVSTDGTALPITGNDPT